MKITILSLFLFGVSIAGFSQETLRVKGEVNGDTKGHNIVYLYGGGIKTDSAVISNGTFEFIIPYVKDMRPLFYTEYDVKIGKGYTPFPVVVDRPGVLKLNKVDIIKGLSSGKWSGIKSAEDYQAFDESIMALYTQVSKEVREKHSTLPGNVKNPAYQKERDSLINSGIGRVFEDFVKAHADSYVSAYILSGMGTTKLSPAQLEKAYGLLSKKRQQSTQGKNITNFLEGLRNSAIGRTIKPFTLNTPEEKPIDFYSLKGKYVLVDFWASWCGPCKQSFPHMKKIYDKYKGDKFEIYSISIDKDKAAWLKESKAQQLPWLQALDTKNISQSNFAITAVPTTYLIDPDGKIAMKEVGFDSDGNGAIEKKLTELFGSK